MDLANLLPFFATSPAVRLLRSPNAPFIAAFLARQFKQASRITVPFSELHAALVAYLDDLQESHPDALRDRPEAYLSNWCSPETRWLHRCLEAEGSEPVYQLTSHTEEVFAFLDHALERNQGFVGTESRLRLVIETLEDLVVGSSTDPQLRLARLRNQRDRIESEIARIESEGAVLRYQPAQIREQFATAVSLLKQLQGDFRAVEEKFKEITRQVQQRQAEGRHTRGGILSFALDAEDVLKHEDQGVSFSEFVRFILAPQQQERLDNLINHLREIRELEDHADGLELLRRMVPLLLAEAEKVMRTNQRLSASLRRLLDLRSRRDRERVGELCAEILGLASSMSDSPPRDVGAEIETRIGILSPFARTFWTEPPRFPAVDLAEHATTGDRLAEAFRVLAEMRRLDWRRMRERVQVAVAEHGTVTLGELLALYPPEAGAIEALAYLQIARDDGHDIRRDGVEEIPLPAVKGETRTRMLEVPLVHFISP
jgi:Protein of unknown function (DUF3375)